MKVSRMTQFEVVKLDFTYKTLFRQLAIHGIKVVPSSYHLFMCYIMRDGSIATVQGLQVTFRVTYKKLPIWQKKEYLLSARH